MKFSPSLQKPVPEYMEWETYLATGAFRGCKITEISAFNLMGILYVLPLLIMTLKL